MKRSLRVLISIASMLLISGQVIGQQTGSRLEKVGGMELRLPLGARAIGMGEAFVGKADDVTAIYWNPAGLGNNKGVKLGFMHSEYLQGTGMEYLAYSQEIFAGSGIGANVMYFHSEDIKKFKEVNGMPEEAGEFSPTFINASIGYGQKLSESVSVGGSVKYLQQKLDEYEAIACAIDAGVLIKPGIKNLQLGGKVENIGSKIGKANLPRQFKVGLSYSWEECLLSQNTCNILLDVSVPWYDIRYVSMNVGSEYWFNDVVAIRGGYKIKPVEESLGIKGLSAGLGLRVKGVEIDYAAVAFGELGLTHQASLSINF